MTTTQLAKIDRAIQRGCGVAARVVGQTYDVRRLAPSMSGSVLDSVPAVPGFPAIIEYTTQKALIEGATFNLLVFIATCDARTLLKGDVFTEKGYGSDCGVYCLAQKRPTDDTLWIRTERVATIRRPGGAAGMATEEPALGAVAVDGYSGTTVASESFAVLTAGTYNFATSGTAATVPIGLQQSNRVHVSQQPDLVDPLPLEHFIAYVPVLAGAQLRQLDRLEIDDDNRYEIISIASSEVGFVGNVCIVQKLH